MHALVNHFWYLGEWILLYKKVAGLFRTTPIILRRESYILQDLQFGLLRIGLNGQLVRNNQILIVSALIMEWLNLLVLHHFYDRIGQFIVVLLPCPLG